jgi:hypothetical protein
LKSNLLGHGGDNFSNYFGEDLVRSKTQYWRGFQGKKKRQSREISELSPKVRGMRAELCLILNKFDQFVRRLIAECGGQMGVRLKNFV